MFDETDVGLAVPKLDGSSKEPAEDDPAFSDDLVVALEVEHVDA